MSKPKYPQISIEPLEKAVNIGTHYTIDEFFAKRPFYWISFVGLSTWSDCIEKSWGTDRVEFEKWFPVFKTEFESWQEEQVISDDFGHIINNELSKFKATLVLDENNVLQEGIDFISDTPAITLLAYNFAQLINTGNILRKCAWCKRLFYPKSSLNVSCYYHFKED